MSNLLAFVMSVHAGVRMRIFLVECRWQRTDKAKSIASAIYHFTWQPGFFRKPLRWHYLSLSAGQFMTFCTRRWPLASPASHSSFPCSCSRFLLANCADRISPRQVLIAGLALQGLCSIAFLLWATSPSPPLWPFFAIVPVLGVARAFADPAGQALLPLLVPDERLPCAIACGSSAWQVAVIAGPALGGLAFAYGPAVAYGICGSGVLAAMLGVVQLGGRRPPPAEGADLKKRVDRVVEGIVFIWSRPVVLGAISLDLFAVLLGGATALLPVYARDILHVGPIGLGLMRSAPAVGACLVALLQVRHPPERRVGEKLFAAVAVFGIATLIFAFSRSLVLSLSALFVLGASDMVSVNIRTSLVQLATPDAMLGRVSAVNLLFIGASSELGAFESGVVAALIGTVPAVAFGGFGTLVVMAVWMRIFPALRRADRLKSEVR